MFGKDRSIGVISVLAIVLGLALSASAAAFVSSTQSPESDKQPGRDVFPFPPELKQPVAFWKQVYSKWDIDQIVLHDMRYLDLVYGVIEIPGAVEEKLTEEQKEWIKDQREVFALRLQRISRLASNPSALSKDDRTVYDRIVKIAGEQAVPHAFDNLRSQRGASKRFKRGLELSGRYESVFRQIFRDAGLPEDLAYLPHVESSFQNHARSWAGASGMWQFMRSTGVRYMMINKALDERLDPFAAAGAAADYLGQAHEELGNWALAVTSYNHGVGGMTRARAQFGHDFGRIVKEYRGRAFGFASRNFYAQFLAAREIASDYLKFFPEGVDFESPIALEYVVLEYPQRVAVLTQRFRLSHQSLTELNPAWTPSARQNRVALPRGSKVWLPNGTLAGKTADNFIYASMKLTDSTSQLNGASYHMVRKNETLYMLAKRYDMSIAQLRDLNGLASDRDLLYVGQKLRVWPGLSTGQRQSVSSDQLYHIVRRGDSPYQIASNYGVSLKELLHTNELTVQSVIRPGQRLVIPSM